MLGCKLTLPLFVARILTNHANHVFALHDAAAFAKAFDGCSYFHGLNREVFGGQKIALGTGFPRAIRVVSLLLAEVIWPFAKSRAVSLTELCTLARYE